MSNEIKSSMSITFAGKDDETNLGFTVSIPVMNAFEYLSEILEQMKTEDNGCLKTNLPMTITWDHNK